MTIEASPGSALFLYTDGLTETRNPREEQYGSERLASLVRQGARLTPRELIDSILKDVTAFRETSPREDDLTIMLIRRA